MLSQSCKLPEGPILIAGFGSIGRRHFHNLQQLGCREFVFYRSRKGTVGDDEIRGFPTASSLDEALSHRPSIAIIANPSALHLEVAIPAAEAGCDLYIEKPLADSLDRIDDLVSIVRKRNLVAMVGCQFRFHPQLIQLREGLEQERLGRVVGASAEWGEYLPSWHPWEDYRRSYSSRAELGGGAILTLIHPLDYLYWMFGPVRNVKSIVARVPSLETPMGEDWVEITAEFQSGVIGRVHLDYLQRPAVHQLSVVGDSGRVTWDYHAGELKWSTVGGEADTQRTPPGFERNTMFVDAMRHFLSCVASRETPCVSLADGLATLRFALDARRSATVGSCDD